jgi:hypothetical protein
MADSKSSLSCTSKLALLGAAAGVTIYAMRQRRRMDFEGKVVVITGASRGLGLELARGFASERAHIVLLARDRQQLAQAAQELAATGAQVTLLGCDVSKEDQCGLDHERAKTNRCPDQQCRSYSGRSLGAYV